MLPKLQHLLHIIYAEPFTQDKRTPIKSNSESEFNQYFNIYIYL